MASTGQSSSNQSLSGTARSAAASYGTGTTSIASAALRKKQLAGALLQASTDQLTIGGVSVTNSGVVGMASSAARQLVPVVLERIAALSTAARSLLPGESLTRSAQMSLSLNGAFCPTILPLFHGSRRAALTVVPMMDLHASGGTARPLGYQLRPWRRMSIIDIFGYHGPDFDQGDTRWA